MECLSNLFHGRVTHIIDPHNFWITCGTDHDRQFHAHYQQKLDSFYNTHGHAYTCDEASLFVGACVVAASESDINVTDIGTSCHWRRAQVLQWDRATNNVDVLFIDLGHSAIVNFNQLRQGVTQLFQILPPQAVPVSLAHIRPLAQTWTMRGKKFFETKVLNQDILISFVVKDEISGHHPVLMYTQNAEGIWQSLIHDIEKEELALLQDTEDTIPVFLTPEVADECIWHMNEIQQRPSPTVEDSLPYTEDTEEEEVAYRHLDEDENEDSNRNACVAPEPDDLQDESTSTTSDHGKADEPLKQGIPPFDLHALAKRTSYSIAQLQQNRQEEIRRNTRAILSASMSNNKMDDLASVSEDQDWDTLRDFDTPDDIQAQIYSGVQRQISDGEGSEFSQKLEMLSRGIVPPEDPPCPHYAGHRSEDHTCLTQVISQEKRRPEASIVITVPHTAKADLEIHNYEIIKKIKEILSDCEGQDADAVPTSIHSIVEPGLDTSAEELNIVLYALLDYSLGKSIPEQEMALRVLGTYSDTWTFIQAMHDVLLKLKDEYVKLPQSIYVEGKYKEFAKLLCMVITHADDWEARPARDIQEFILYFVCNWILFNKKRQQNTSQVFDTELMFLECAEIVLTNCFNDMQDRYYERFADMMVELRYKIIHDTTPRWIRERILDLMLKLHCKGGFSRESTEIAQTHNKSTQTRNDQDQSLRSTHDDKEHYANFSKRSARSNDSSLHPNTMKEREDSPDQFSYCSNSTPFSSSFPTQQLLLESEHFSDSDKAKSTTHGGFSKFTQEPSDGVPKFPKESNENNDQIHSLPALSSEQHYGTCVPAESVSASVKPKKRGVPKSIRNLPPHLRRICQVDAPDSSLSDKEETSVKEDPSDSTLLVDRGSHADNTTGDRQKFLFKEAEGTVGPIPSDMPKEDKSSLNNQKHSGNSAMLRNIESSQRQCGKESSFNSHISESITAFEQRKTRKEETSNYHKDSSAVINDASNIPSSYGDDLFEEEDKEVSETNTVNSFIRYSIEQLKEMNPASNPLPVEDLLEPFEVLERQICEGRIKIDLTSFRERYNRLGWAVRGNAPLPHFKFKKHLAVDDLSNDTSDFKSSSTENESKSEDISDNQQSTEMPTLFNTPPDTSTLSTNMGVVGSLRNISVDSLFAPTIQPIPESHSEAESYQETEVWQEEHDREGTSSDVLQFNESLKNSKGKGKKKKIKYRPLDFFKSTDPVPMDEQGDRDGDIEHFDEFSPEALRMYEELERADHADAISGQIITHGRIGSSTLNISKRPSLFAKERYQYQQQKPLKPWCPGKRKCTRCGSEDHTIDDCEEDSFSRFKW